VGGAERIKNLFPGEKHWERSSGNQREGEGEGQNIQSQKRGKKYIINGQEGKREHPIAYESQDREPET